MATPPRLAVIITALPIEREAVLEHLRNVGPEPELRGSIYRRGTFDERSEPWDVIVAEIGAGNEGAAAEAERVIAHYAPQVALFVGIAGAVKDLTHGHVVASTKVYRYESGKDDKSGFKTRPAVQLAGYALEQRARYEAGEPDWRLRIKGGGPPGDGDPPAASVGPIAAGEAVVASNRSRTYRFIRKHYSDAVAVEMEGHGFLLGVHMNHPTQGIVIRGISDCVDDKDEANDEKWQPVAAWHAAAFAFQILARLPASEDGGAGRVAAVLDADWQDRHLQDARAAAGPRYSAELNVGTPLHDAFEALCGTDAWFASLHPRRRTLCKAVQHWSRSAESDGSQTWSRPFPEQLRAAGRAVAEQLHVVGNAFADLVARKEGASPTLVGEAATFALPPLRELHESLRRDLEAQHGPGTADSAQFRQFQASYQMAFPAANVDAAKELVSLLEGLETWSRSVAGRAAGAKGVLVAGAAGAGKTHAICDIAHDRARRGLRTVVLFGEHFTSEDEPWERIRQSLGLPSMSRDDLLGALDASGRASGGPLLLCIDGLNESRPRGYWRGRLAALAAQIARFTHIRLCVSCRSTYEPLVVPTGHGLERVEHVGFAGMENTACRAFFEYNGLEPPVAPSFHPEFANPLFLRLACETLKAAGQRRMLTGWRGINTALRAFVREKNRAFAQEFEREEQDRIPQRALDEFMGEVERTRRVYLRWSDANAAVNRAQPGNLSGATLLGWLVREGLLITDANPEDLDPDSEDVVRVAFERLGEHLFAARLLGKIHREALRPEIESGSLAFAFSDGDAVLANRGLVEALSIQLPESPDFACELIDVLPDSGPRDRVLRATADALPWRDPECMTVRTCEIVLEAISDPGFGHEAFDSLLAIACQETAPDALWLHGLLSRRSMPHRDRFLCGYLHERFGVSSAVDRLLRAPFEVEAHRVPEPVVLRWATLLLWFCAAADRRVRDRATKGLVAITQPHPHLWAALIRQFGWVNDEYVVERCLCAAYGTLLRTRDVAAETSVAAAVYDVVFADPLVYQNGLIRDHAHCIVDLAARDGVLPGGIDPGAVRPPYRSEWPLAIPTDDEVNCYRGAHQDYPRLHTSCLDDDYFVYLLSRLDQYEHAVSRLEMGRWVLRQVIEVLGYGGPVMAGYDRYMIHRHGGGRGRPGWAERIGKKYQWIALSRLAARLADNVAPEQDDWAPEVNGTPLVYSSGRDIDPGLLTDGRPGARRDTSWWLPQVYDFAAVEQMDDAAWAATPDDLPSSEQFLRPLTRESGGEWQLLEGYPEWSSRGEADDSAKYRWIWMQIRGYFVKAKSANRAFAWLGKQHFMGRWMPEGAGFHEGFIGEYPWGIPFTLHPDSWHSQGGGRKKPPVRLTPVCNSITSNYQEDAFQDDGITIQVPARTFFQDERLRWDGLSGYRGPDGRLRFLDPSLREAGGPALLIDREYLLGYLRRRDLVLVWTVLGEKQILGGGDRPGPMLEFSRAHLLDHQGDLRSSELVVEVS